MKKGTHWCYYLLTWSWWWSLENIYSPLIYWKINMMAIEIDWDSPLWWLKNQKSLSISLSLVLLNLTRSSVRQSSNNHRGVKRSFCSFLHDDMQATHSMNQQIEHKWNQTLSLFCFFWISKLIPIKVFPKVKRFLIKIGQDKWHFFPFILIHYWIAEENK